MTEQCDQVHVPADMSRLLCALKYGWEPHPFELGEVKEIKLGEMEASDLAAKLHFERDRLKATLTLKIPGFMQPIAHVGFCGVLVGGATFRADSVLHVQRSLAASASGVAISMTLEGSEWVILDGKASSVWVGRIEGLGPVVGSGNLVVERPGSSVKIGSRRCHFRFSGNYLYYLVQRGTEPIWHLVIDTAGGGVPDSELLGRDFLVLQFVLGRQLRMPLLSGIGSDLRTVGVTVGSAIRKNLEEASYSPVPFERGNDDWIDGCWTSVLFEKVAARWKRSPEMRMGFWLALDMYLDAMTNHLDWE